MQIHKEKFNVPRTRFFKILCHTMYYSSASLFVSTFVISNTIVSNVFTYIVACFATFHNLIILTDHFSTQLIKYVCLCNILRLLLFLFTKCSRFLFYNFCELQLYMFNLHCVHSVQILLYSLPPHLL